MYGDFKKNKIKNNNGKERVKWKKRGRNIREWHARVEITMAVFSETTFVGGASEIFLAVEFRSRNNGLPLQYFCLSHRHPARKSTYLYEYIKAGCISVTTVCTTMHTISSKLSSIRQV